MKFHTDVLSYEQINNSLRAAKEKGHVTWDVYFAKFERCGSRARARGCEIQLGTDDQTSGPTKSRHHKNSGQYGADHVWAATWDEWGWFILELFTLDPDAIFGYYKGVKSFHEQTQGKFRPILTEWP